MNIFSTPVKFETRELLVIGFGDQFLQQITPGKDASAYLLQEVDSPFQAWHWLSERVEQERPLPFAIVFDYQSMEKERFHLLNSIASHPVLAQLPLVAINTESVKVNRSQVLGRGLDDLFPAKTEWNRIRQRIEFLKKHKQDIKGIHLAITPEKPFRIPFEKRVFDLVFASAILIMISPLLLLIAVAIKLESRGPIIYRSKRVGTGYQKFDFLKFRSMVVDADAKLQALSHLNQYTNDSNAAFFKLKNDPRITAVGRFIRKTSLDELPQLFNVLRGEMSIVGNRPLPVYEAETMTSDQWAKRFLAPAGITGLWQTATEGKDNLTVEQRVGMDIEYAENYSLAMDLAILTKTLKAMYQKED